TEFVSGSVASVLAEAHRLEESIIKRYTKQMLQAITFLHSKGFSNLNLKVSNMLVDNQGNVKLADYAAVQEISDLVHRVYRSNVEWMSSGDEKDKEGQQKRVDLQNLGLTLIEMATGSRDARAMPVDVSKEAKGFVDLCIKGYAIAGGILTRLF